MNQLTGQFRDRRIIENDLAYMQPLIRHVVPNEALIKWKADLLLDIRKADQPMEVVATHGAALIRLVTDTELYAGHPELFIRSCRWLKRYTQLPFSERLTKLMTHVQEKMCANTDLERRKARIARLRARRKRRACPKVQQAIFEPFQRMKEQIDRKREAVKQVLDNIELKDQEELENCQRKEREIQQEIDALEKRLSGLEKQQAGLDQKIGEAQEANEALGEEIKQTKRAIKKAKKAQRKAMMRTTAIVAACALATLVAGAGIAFTPLANGAEVSLVVLI